MRFLFCSEHYPGPLGALAALCAGFAGSETVFATGRQRTEIPIPNVQRVVLKKKRPIPEEDRYDLGWSEGIRTGQFALHTFKGIAASFQPDIIFVAAANGIAFFLREAFPKAFIVSYAQTDYEGLPPSMARAHNAMQAQQLLFSDLAYATSEASKNFFPPLLRTKIGILPFSVDTKFFSRQMAQPYGCWKFPQTPRKLPVFNLAGLAPEQAHVFVRGAVRILQADSEIFTVLIIRERQQLAGVVEFISRLPPEIGGRIFATAAQEAGEMRNLLASASVVILPNAAQNSFLLEAMSCHAPVMAQAGRWPFLKSGENMLPLEADFVEAITSALAKPQLLGHIGQNARQTALSQFSESKILWPHLREIFSASGFEPAGCEFAVARQAL